ncbi:signal peptidase I [Enterococcus caccae]|uniref:Signal peptidase I n=1 Tax=Enterococcus caccae ATCC BAA-1240 TaxID=1158612 RepID=R3WIN2_9ENTE|nr:signal peptidase I [Enterococcus caccae]EOL47706.1 signal peptidase I [Enterococcus caccae ATCC BAA-1240]EOT65504.1 signal peptidase I [Enterococcus caccae ATCC BAA-1240]OJG27315.1 signal peptidase I [Enterococcus caccae]
MPKKTPVRKNGRSKYEKAGRSNSRRSRDQTYAEPKRLYLDNERYDERVVRKRPRPKIRNSHNDFYEESGPRRLEYQEAPRPQQTRRPIPTRRMSDEYNRRPRSQPVAKSPGVLVFSFISNLVFYGVTIGIVLMAVMFSFSSKSTASIFGYRFYTVLTNSMVPQENGPKGGFYAGDVVIVKLMDGDKVKKDDIVTFAVGDGSRYLTHRMVERMDELNGKKGNYLVTKGDANKSNDPPITSDRVLGKVVFAVPKIGSAIEFAREEFWACLVCILSLYGFFLVLKSYLFTSDEDLNERRKKRRALYER